VKRAALYMRVSTVDQHPETQVYDLRQMAAQRGYEIVQEHTDKPPENIEFVSFRESIDTSGPLGWAIVVIIGAIAELERNLIVERVRTGMRRARLEGRRSNWIATGSCVIVSADAPFGQIAREYRVSRTTVHRVLPPPKKPVAAPVPKGVSPLQTTRNKQPDLADPAVPKGVR